MQITKFMLTFILPKELSFPISTLFHGNYGRKNKIILQRTIAVYSCKLHPSYKEYEFILPSIKMIILQCTNQIST